MVTQADTNGCKDRQQADSISLLSFFKKGKDPKNEEL
jgi:hypothetical protein